MEKITKYFTHDYEKDTTIEWVSTGKYSMLNCSFTSEDEDYGTDTIHYGVGSDSVKHMEQMAYEMLGELTPYLSKKDRGETWTITKEMEQKYGDYSNSTLYAVEHALKIIAEDYRARKWFAHLEDATREIARRMFNDGNKTFSFCVSNEEYEQYEQYGSGWYGIKRLDSIFDNDSYEYIVAVGYYGGGCVESAYAYFDGTYKEEFVNELGRKLCDAIIKIAEAKEQSVVYVVEEEK